MVVLFVVVSVADFVVGFLVLLFCCNFVVVGIV